MIRNLIFIILLSFVFTSCAQKKDKNELDFINIEGTRVLFPKSSSFTKPNDIVGLVNNSNAYVLVTEILNDSFENHINNSNNDYLEKDGSEILEAKDYKISGFDAKELIIKSPDSIKIRMLIFGDNSFCTTITSKHYLNDTQSEDEIKYLIDNLKYDKTLKIDPYKSSPFSLDDNNTRFKFFFKSQNTFFYTTNGKERKNRLKNPSLAIFYGKLRNETLNDVFKHQTSFEDTHKYKKKINGYDAYECVYELSNKNKRYVLVLENKNTYIVVRGTAMENFDKTISDFKNFSHQIRLKKYD